MPLVPVGSEAEVIQLSLLNTSNCRAHVPSILNSDTGKKNGDYARSKANTSDGFLTSA